MVASKDIGARKIEECICVNSDVAVLYPAMTVATALTSMHKLLPTAKAT